MIKVIGCTDLSDSVDLEKAKIISGKFGGTCYAAEGFATIKNQSDEKALNRANKTANSNHHSVFGHFEINLEIECSKMMAMVLNSIQVSNTSEKSARYTKMKPETERESELYKKWSLIFQKLIEDKYPGKFTDKEKEKLGNENGRYMISVFTPTSMVYSIPIRNLFYLMQWIGGMIENMSEKKTRFNQKFKDECILMRNEIMEILKDYSYISDNKDEYLRFLPVQSLGPYISEEMRCENSFGNKYTANYRTSLACMAQNQRHRTIDYKVFIYGSHESLTREDFYVPDLILATEYRNEWLDDIMSVREYTPQGMLVDVIEQGNFEDFILKCKERMCNRAQLEVMNLTIEWLEIFNENRFELSKFNQRLLDQFINKSGVVVPRCVNCYKCTDGCKFGRSLNRSI